MLDAVYVDTVEEKTVVAMTPRPAFMPLFEVATTGRVREWCWSMNKSCLRMLKTQRQLQVRVSGGDGGESNSPSRRHPGRIYYKLVRYFESRPLMLLPAESPRAQPKVPRRSLIGVGTATGLEDSGYKWGFTIDIESDVAPKGLSEEIVRFISSKKGEPDWMLDWRLKAYRHWIKLNNEEPTWANVKHPPINFQDIIYYAAPVSKSGGPQSLDEVDPELVAAFDKLGIPIEEQKKLSGVAVDAVLDSVSVATTFKETLDKQGIIFCSFTEAVQKHPELVKKYLGSVVPYTDNFYATLNSAVFSDGSFAYIPKGVRCPLELMTYFRINQADSGQFERTLIIADEGSYVSYLEGCTAPSRKNNQLHAAVVELVALKDAEIKYSTLQNWFPGDKDGKGGVYNFVTKRGKAAGRNSKISWTQVETGSAITWKYPSVILQGDNSVGEFYSVALVNNYQQADTGTKMLHIGKNTRSTIFAKGISAGKGNATYRGQVKINPSADGARNFTQCDSLLIGDQCGAHTVPYIEVRNPTAKMEHEATTSKVSDDQLFYLQQRGISLEDAHHMIIKGIIVNFSRAARYRAGVSVHPSHRPS